MKKKTIQRIRKASTRILTLVYSGLLSLILVGAFSSTAAAQNNDVEQYSIEQFLKTTSYRGASFSHDNSKLLVSNDATGVFNAYSIDVKSGISSPLTKSAKDSVFGISYFPGDDRFLYTADQGGNELNHVYVQLADGSAEDLTLGENLKASFAGWADDDQSFYISTNERDPKFFDVYEYQIADFSRAMAFQNDGGFMPGAFSRDGNLIALIKMETRDNSDIYIYDRKAETTKCVTGHEGDISNSVRHGSFFSVIR